MPDSGPKCIPEDEAGQQGSSNASGDRSDRLFHAQLSRAFWWLRGSKRCRDHAVCYELHRGLRHQGGHSRSSGVCCPLFMVGLEQAAQDQGRWDLAFQLMLLEYPPSQMWSYRGAGILQTGRARAFAPLCPQRWATVALAYTKEIDYIQSKPGAQQEGSSPGACCSSELKSKPKSKEEADQVPKCKAGSRRRAGLVNRRSEVGTSVGSDGGISFAAQCGTVPLPSSLPLHEDLQGESAL